jgi:hypothetical protein
MTTIHLTYTDPAAQPAIALMRRAFPSYTGRSFKVRIANGPVDVRSAWDGGSRDYFAFVRLDGSSVTPPVPAQSAFDRRIAGAEAVELPAGVACVEHTIFCGKDLGCTLILAPENAPALLPPAADDLPAEVARVVVAAASMKNSYGGESDRRFAALARRHGMTRAQYETACTEAVTRGLLNKAGAVTPNGRNAVADHPERHDLDNHYFDSRYQATA